MSMAPSRIAAAGGMTLGGVPTVIRVRTSEETSLTYGIPLVAIAQDTPDGDCSITIDWGDNTVRTYPVDPTRKCASYFLSDDSAMVHTYALPGVYRVTIDGRATDIMLGSDSSASVVTAYKTYAGMVEAVEQWGSSVRLGSALMSGGSDVYQMTRDGFAASFRSCANLTHVAPVTFAAVGPYAITGSPLATLDGMTTASTVIYSHAFSESAVTGATWWPSGQTTVPERCFYRAGSLTSLVGMESVTAAESDAFNGCSALTSLDGLSSLASAGHRCFKDCTSLARFDKLDQYGVPMQSMALATLGSECFAGCTALTSLVSLPHLVTELTESCFEGCTGLANIYIPGQVLTIRAYAFKNCGATSVAFYEPEITSGNTVKRPARYAAPTRIDQAAFIGQAESGWFYAPSMTASQLRDIKGSLSYSDTIHDSTNPMSVSWSKYWQNSDLVESKDWFTCDNPTFAPWGLGRSWELLFSGSVGDPTTDHNSVICADFLAAPGDDAPAVDGSTKLERMEAARIYNSGGYSYTVTPQFSPYGEERG